ncbi:hypothetical protein [Paenibacillus pabuli]|uniref:hypothetical protein n=1 Tax=Paenibacillus pabuli TaxID=1472 RepID=UPI003CF57315
MPLIDNYLLDNYLIDGPSGVDLSTLKSRSLGTLPSGASSQNITNLEFTPVFAVFTAFYADGNYSYNMCKVIGLGGINPTVSASGINSNAVNYLYYNRNITVTGVVFGANSLSFTHNSTAQSVTCTIYGF